MPNKILKDAFIPLAKLSEKSSILNQELYAQSEDFDRSAICPSFSARAVHVARSLSLQLIDERGLLDKKALFSAIQDLEKSPFSLGPGRQGDDDRQEQLLQLLRHLHDDADFARAFKKISRPAGHLAAERLIRETLLLDERTPLKDVDAKRAVLAAFLTYLRQTVGSCFATAPAIMIQLEQSLRLLEDLTDLLSTGRLTRVIDGEEYAVPLSISWGAGQLFMPITNRSLEEISRCPGLRTALGLEKKELEEKLSLFQKKLERPFSILTADEILRGLLMQEFQVNEKEVTAYLERESVGVMGQLVIQSEPTSSKQLACSRYLKALEKARSSFKAVTENALLRAWEYTLASLAETKADFASWNLYSSLGLSPEEPGGIGSALQATLQEMLVSVNQEIEEYQSKYDHLFATAKYLEGRMRRASEREIGWITADYHIRRQEINRMLSERDEAAERGRRLASFFNFSVRFFADKFKEYFQEVYDAEMHSLTDSPYDDSPAGFRLLYKHGRTNTALWTHIHNAAEFVQALTSFFNAIEVELTMQKEAEGLRHEVGRMITAIIRAIKEPDFVKAATARLVASYRDPKRLPWAYISGGTMTTLVSCYYTLIDKPTEEKRWVESPTELLAFYIDVIKELPHLEQRMFVQKPKRSMLAYSPTHAFLLQPGRFAEAWENDLYTYTWIRDHFTLPGQVFLDEQQLDKRDCEFLVDKLLLSIPKGYRPIVKKALEKLPFPLLPFEFRDNCIKILSYEKWLNPSALQYIADEIEALLFQHLPLFSEHQLFPRLEALFLEMEELNADQTDRLIEMAQALDMGRYSLFSAEDLLDVAKGLLISLLQTTRSSIPFHQRIVHTQAKLGFRFPVPLIVGDSNWVQKRLGFVVGPGSRELELWCVDNYGSAGRPLSQWRSYLDGSRQVEWGLFTKPSQYGQY